MAKAILNITGMTCGHCVAAVTKALEKSPGVTTAQVDLQSGRATVDFDEQKTTAAALATVVMDEGYMAEEAV